MVFRIDSEPAEATVIIDGKRRGVTPLRIALRLGTHRIELEREGYDTVRAVVEGTPGQDNHLRLQLERSR